MAHSENSSFKSDLADRSDSLRSVLADGSDILRSALEGGHDYLFENCCDLCEYDGLQKEAVGFCVDCEDHLCTECFRNHIKPKPLRHHVLLDQHQMPSRELKRSRVHHVMDIKVRSNDDSEKPWITGLVVLSGDTIVAVDYLNNTVKLIEISRSTTVSWLKLGGELWDITQVDATRVAVTSYNTHAIFLVNVKAKQLILDHTIKVKGQCWGITRINDNLIVSYDRPMKVEIISMEGKVLHTVIAEEQGRVAFSSPWYVAVSKDQHTVYISDWHRQTVTRVDLTGEDGKLRCPRGLTVGSAGRVYVCGEKSNNIMQLTANLTEIQELLQLNFLCLHTTVRPLAGSSLECVVI